MLTNIVIIPVEKFTFNEIPWARTLQGEAPANDTINNPSPKPNKIRPNTRKKSEENFGLRFSRSFELQKTLGIFFIVKNMLIFLLLGLNKNNL
jgi:hypothetical protein